MKNLICPSNKNSLSHLGTECSSQQDTLSTNNEETLEQEFNIPIQDNCSKFDIEIENFKLSEEEDPEITNTIIATILEKGEAVHDVEGNEILSQ